MPEFDPDNFGNGPWNNTTTLHPLGALLIAVLGLAILLLPRRWAVAPMIVAACFVASAQRIVIFTLDFDLLRVMVLFGATRVLVRNEISRLTWHPIDTVLMLWVASAVIMNTLLNGTLPDFINRLGFAFDALGMYFLFRCLVQEWQDVDQTILTFIIVSLPVAIAFLVESSTGRNAFAFFGGVPEITMVRAGRLRCQGAFAHPILAGCFWASLAPLFAARWWRRGIERGWAVVGLATTAVIVLTCSSSTPVTAVLMGIVAACFFPLRQHMRWVRWGIVSVLVGLHLIMKAPVWHLLARIDIFSGSTGYHRYWLIDLAVKHFGDWWLMGTTTAEHWDPGAEFFDVTNQYLWEAINGGLLQLVLFIAVIVSAFRSVGRLWRASSCDVTRVATAWALGVSLFVHVMTFVSISYFGQTIMVWYLLLAMIASLSPISAIGRAPRVAVTSPARVLSSSGVSAEA